MTRSQSVRRTDQYTDSVDTDIRGAGKYREFVTDVPPWNVNKKHKNENNCTWFLFTFLDSFHSVKCKLFTNVTKLQTKFHASQ